MKRSVFVSSISAVAALLSQPALAEIKVRLGPTNINYSFDATFSDRTVSATTDYGTALNLGVTYIRESGLYFDVATTAGKRQEDPRDTSKYLNRTDFTVVMGQADVDDNGNARSIYVGLKSGFSRQTMPILYAGQVEEFKSSTKGLVSGAGMGFPLDIGGTFGVNAGLGLMQMNLNRSSAPGDVDSDQSLGYSWGVSYTYPFTKESGVVLEYKGNGYSYKFSGVLPAPTTVNEKWTVAGLIFYASF